MKIIWTILILSYIFSSLLELKLKKKKKLKKKVEDQLVEKILL